MPWKWIDLLFLCFVSLQRPSTASVIFVRQFYQYALSPVGLFPVPSGDKTAFICCSSPHGPSGEPLVLRHFSYIFDNLGSEHLALFVSSTTKMSQVPKESLSAQIQALPW